ncbi:MAG: hypothetical protein ACI9WS_002700 [Paraglaciecola psychrophila]|jgi:hypothetical protein
MLELGNEFYLAWVIYLAAVLLAQLLLWKLTVGFKRQELGALLRLSALAVLITPAKLDAAEGPGSYWAPAFITAMMEGLGGESEAALGRLLPMLALLLVLVVISLLWKLLRRKTA